MTALALRFGAIVGLIVVASIDAGAANDAVPAPVDAFATEADPHPQACVDCHINMVDAGIDGRFSTALRQWSVAVPDELMTLARATMARGTKPLTGKHPPAEKSLTDIPDACIGCHAADASAAPPFAQLMHLVHYTGEANHFMSEFAGDCVRCHKLNRQSGEWSIPSGPERDQ